MGGSQSSTHTVTIDNDDLSTIQVSKAVADRLTKGIQTSESSSSNQSKPTTTSTPTSQTTSSTETKQINYNIPSSNISPTQYISSLDLHKHIQKSIQDNNKYWSLQIESIQKKTQDITNNMNKEYEKTMQQINEILPTISKHKNINSCKNNEENIIKCIANNKKQILVCLNEINQFNKCIINSQH